MLSSTHVSINIRTDTNITLKSTLYSNAAAMKLTKQEHASTEERTLQKTALKLRNFRTAFKEAFLERKQVRETQLNLHFLRT